MRLCLIATFVTGAQAGFWSSVGSFLKKVVHHPIDTLITHPIHKYIYCNVHDCRPSRPEVWKSLETERKQMEESRKAVDFAKIPMKDYAMLMSHDSAMGYRTEASKFRKMLVLCPPRVDHRGGPAGDPHPCSSAGTFFVIYVHVYGESSHHRFVSRDCTISEHNSHIATLLYHCRYCRIRSCPQLEELSWSVPEHYRSFL